MVWLGLVTGTRPRAHPVPYLPGRLGTPARAGAPPIFARDGCTSMHFGENQLSPGSIGISPLSTGHPPVLQHGWVRASTGSHPRFTLPMDSSPGFGSDARDASRPLQARFRSGSAAVPPLNLAWAPPAGGLPPPARPAATIHLSDHSTKGTPSAHPPGRPGSVSSLRLLVGAGVQGLFHPPRGVLFTFPSRYSFP